MHSMTSTVTLLMRLCNVPTLALVLPIEHHYLLSSGQVGGAFLSTRQAVGVLHNVPHLGRIILRQGDCTRLPKVGRRYTYQTLPLSQRGLGITMGGLPSMPSLTQPSLRGQRARGSTKKVTVGLGYPQGGATSCSCNNYPPTTRCCKHSPY